MVSSDQVAERFRTVIRDLVTVLLATGVLGIHFGALARGALVTFRNVCHQMMNTKMIRNLSARLRNLV